MNVPNSSTIWLSDLLSDRRDRARYSCQVAKDLIQEAAALWESLSQNHPFIDGNKRVAVTMTAAFPRINGYRLNFTDADACAFLLNLYEAGNFRLGELEKWLRQHTSQSSNH